VPEYSTEKQDVNHKGICPAALGSKDEQPAAYSPDTGLFYVPTNHVCMDYEPFRVSYTAGQPYVGATLSMYPPPGESHMGNFIAWDGKTGKIVWSVKEQFSVWSGALATAGGVVFYGTLEGYLKAVDAKTGKELYKFKTPSGIIGNVTTYRYREFRLRHALNQRKDRPVRQVVVAIMLAAGPFVVGASLVLADGVGDPTAVKHDDGRYYDKESNPTFKVQSDGTVDWGTYSGFRRYHSDCHVCHGPDAEGSSYAPALSNYLKTKNYVDFANVVVNGRKNVNTAQESVMPSFGTNPNVMCYIGDIFVYLRARANDAVPRGRPQKHEDKPEAATQAENSCLGHKS